MTKQFLCDNCGNVIGENEQNVLFIGLVDVDFNNLEMDLCNECSKKAIKLLKEGWQ